MSTPKLEVFDHILKEMNYTVGPDGPVRKPFQVLTTQQADVDEVFLAMARAGKFRVLTRMFTHAPRETLAKIPEEILAKKDENGLTVMHCAALTGGLGKMPVGTLTPDRLLARDARGLSPISIAAAHGQLSQIPITKELTERMQEVQEALRAGMNSKHAQSELIRGAHDDWSEEFTRLAVNGLAPTTAEIGSAGIAPLPEPPAERVMSHEPALRIAGSTSRGKTAGLEKLAIPLRGVPDMEMD